MPGGRFESGATTAKLPGRLAALLLVAVLAAVAASAAHPWSRSGPAASPGSTGRPTPSAASAAVVTPAPTAAGRTIGLDWGIVPDATGLAGLGTPVDAASGPAGIVVTGSSGVAWSADGRTWSPVADGPVGLPVVATTGGYFALGDGAGWTSGDGRTWSTEEAREAQGFDILDIAVAGATLVAVGSLARDVGWDAAFVSADGWTWRREGGVLPAFEQLAASGSIVVASGPVPDQGHQVAIRRADGSWSPPLPLPGDTADVGAIAARPSGGFVAAGTQMVDGRLTSAIWTSGDGSAWSGHAVTGLPAGTTPTSVAVSTADGALVAAAAGGFWRSSDGTTWTPAPDVPSFVLGSPTVVTPTPAGLIGLGASADGEQAPLAWTSPPLAAEPTVADRFGSWTTASLPTTTEDDRLVAMPDGRLLLFGGVLRDGPTLRYTQDVWLREIDGTWVPRSPMPRAREYIVSVLAGDGRVLLVGGVSAGTGGVVERRVDIYDPATDRWSSGPELPAEWVLDAIAMPDGSIVAMGYGTELWRLAPGSRAWKLVVRPVPERGADSAGRLDDGSLLVMSPLYLSEVIPGTAGTIDRPVLVATRIDPTTGVTASRAASTAGQGRLVELADGRLVLAGLATTAGDGRWRLSRRIDVYDAARDTWRILTLLPASRLTPGLAADGAGRLYVAGGEAEIESPDGPSPTDTLFIWTPPDQGLPSSDGRRR